MEIADTSTVTPLAEISPHSDYNDTVVVEPTATAVDDLPISYAIPEVVGTVVPAVLGLHTPEPTEHVVIEDTGAPIDVKPPRRLETLLALVRQFNGLAQSKDDRLKELQARAAQVIAEREPFSIMAWTNLTDTALARALLDGNPTFQDPRPNLKTDCVFLGKAQNAKPEDVMSFCFPKDGDNCYYRACCSVTEVVTYLDHLDSDAKKLPVPNPFAVELRTKIPEVADMVGDTLTDELISTIRFQHEVRQLRSSILDITDPKDTAIVRVVGNFVAEFIQKVPGAAQVGGIINWTANRTPAFIKNSLSTLSGALKWVFNNPFYTNLIIILGKSLRIVLCAYLSGVEPKDVKFILESMFEAWKGHPMVNLLINVTSSLLSCLTSIGLKGIMNPVAYIECVTKILGATFDTYYTFSYKYMKQLILYVIRRVLELVAPKKTVNAIWSIVEQSNECIDHPWQCVQAVFLGSDDAAVQLSMNPAIRNELLVNISATVFFGILCLIPVQLIDALFDLLIPFVPAGGHIVNAKRWLLATATKLSGQRNLSLGDLVLVASKTASVHSSVLAVCMEMYAWFIDVGGCWLKKVKARIAPETAKAEEACCFKDLVDKIKSILESQGQSGFFGMARRGVENVSRWVNSINPWGSSASYLGSQWSDRRLKHLLHRNPVFTIKSKGKLIKFYLYMWNMDAVRKLPTSAQKHFNPHHVYIGVLAQELQKSFPKAVTLDKHTNTFQIDQSKLGCNLMTILCALNGTLPPAKCHQKQRITLEKIPA